MTSAPAATDAAPTRAAPLRLIAVAPQITASARIHSSVPDKPGKKYLRYWLNRIGYSAMSTREYIHVIQPFWNAQKSPNARCTQR